MIRWHLKALIGQYNSQYPHEQLTYRQIADETGLALSSISQIANNNTGRVDFATLEALLGYFSRKFGRQMEIGDLLVYYPMEGEEGDNQ